MAFKILSSAEIELLTEKQRKSYEEELAIYNERVKFVEQMEKFENTVMAPYEPKLVPISAVGRAPEKVYTHPEYSVETMQVSVAPPPEIAAIQLLQPVTAAVPTYYKPHIVSVEHKKRVGHSVSALPPLRKAVAPVSAFVKAEQNPVTLPAKEKLTVPGIRSENVGHVKDALSTTVVPQHTSIKPVSVESIKRVQQNTAALPLVSKAVAPVRAFVKSEQEPIRLPAKAKHRVPGKAPVGTAVLKAALSTVTIPKHAIINIVPAERSMKAVFGQPVFPSIGKAAAPVATFTSSGQHAPILPIGIKLAAPDKKVNAMGTIKASLPMTAKPQSLAIPPFVPVSVDRAVRRNSYHAITPSTVHLPALSSPEKVQLTLPKIPRPNQFSVAIQKPDFTFLTLPNAQKAISPTVETFKTKYAFTALPAVNVSKPEISPHASLTIQKSTLPKVSKPTFIPKPYAKPNTDSVLKLDFPSTPVVPVKTVKKVAAHSSEISKIKAVVVPDAYTNESLKNLLPSK